MLCDRHLQKWISDRQLMSTLRTMATAWRITVVLIMSKNRCRWYVKDLRPRFPRSLHFVISSQRSRSAVARQPTTSAV